MVEIKLKDAIYYYNLGLQIIIKNNNDVELFNGTKNSNQKIENLLKDKENKAFIKKNEELAFLKYNYGLMLAGIQLFVSFLCITIAFFVVLFISLKQGNNHIYIIPFVTILISLFGFKVFKDSKRKIKDFLN